MEKLNIQQLADQTINDFVESAKKAFGDNLVSALVFGSAADSKLRVTSDVNLMIVIKVFKKDQADQLREPLRLGRALIQLHVMFILESEIQAATDAFTLKFADIQLRHRLIFGKNPLANIHPSRAELISKTKQSLLNFQLKSREQYVLISLREEQLALIVANAAPVLRSSANAIRQIEGQGSIDGKLALEEFTVKLNKPYLIEAIKHMSQAREEGILPHGQSAETLLQLLELSQFLYIKTCDLGAA